MSIDTAEFITLLTGEDDPIMNLRTVPERPGSRTTARKLRGRYSQLKPQLAAENKAGSAIYYTANKTDGKGVKKENIAAARCIVADFDGTPLPDTWAKGIAPHAIVETSPGKFQCVFLIEATKDIAAAEDIARRAAAYYDADPKVCDASHIFRLPGFLHQKGKPFRSRVIDMRQFDPPYALDAFSFLPELPEKIEGQVSGTGTLSPERLEILLNAWDVTTIRGNDLWGDTAMSVHAATGGDPDAKELFLDWSDEDPDPKFSREDNERRWDSFDANKPVLKGIGTLIKIAVECGVPDDVMGQAFTVSAADDFDEEIPPEWLTDDSALKGTEFEAEPVAPIFYDSKQQTKMLMKAEAALLASGVPLYQMGGRLVHPLRAEQDSIDDDAVRRRAGSLTIGPVTARRLRLYMDENLRFVKSKEGKPVKVAVPMALANDYLDAPDLWKIPGLRGLIETPTLRRDGSLIVDDGYDARSHLLLDKGGVEFPAIPDRPTREQAEAALDLLKQPFKDFPCVVNAKGLSPSRSVLLSAVLTGLVRRSLGSAPMHGTTAPTMGTGKTLAWDVVSMIDTGRATTAMSQGANEAEDEKRLFSVLLQGDQIVMIDNVKRAIEGDALCTILTQPTWQSRILGENRNVAVPTNVLMLASGNNLEFKGDMMTRALLCRMDAGVERPEQRRFKVDLKKEVPRMRTKLVAAGLTVLRAFVVAGRPGLDRLTPFGRFEDWSNLVRGALVWLGEPDPCRTRAFVAANDTEQGEHEALLAAMKDNMGDDWLTVGQIVNIADECSDTSFIEAIRAVAPKGDTRLFANYLSAKEGRIIGSLRLERRKDKKRKTWTYHVGRVE